MVVMAVVMSTFCGSGVVHTQRYKVPYKFWTGAGRSNTPIREGYQAVYSLIFSAKVQHFGAARNKQAALPKIHEMRRYMGEMCLIYFD